MWIVERTTIGAECRATINVDFGTRTARTGFPHLPKVVFVAESLDAIHRYADLLVPDCLGFVVTFVDGDPQPIAVETEHLGHEVPRPRNCIFLEVVAEAEVTEHLEEDEMSFRATDIIEVVVLASGPGALLNTDRPRIRGYFVTNEVRLERHHSGNREEHRWVVRNEACRIDPGVTTLGEIAAESFANLVGSAGTVGCRHWATAYLRAFLRTVDIRGLRVGFQSRFAFVHRCTPFGNRIGDAVFHTLGHTCRSERGCRSPNPSFGVAATDKRHCEPREKPGESTHTHTLATASPRPSAKYRNCALGSGCHGRNLDDGHRQNRPSDSRSVCYRFADRFGRTENPVETLQVAPRRIDDRTGLFGGSTKFADHRNDFGLE